MNITRPTVMEVDLNSFRENIKNIKKYVDDKEIMPVIKANAYGTHINKNLNILNMFDIVAVAMVDEAIDIRKLGYGKDIFILNQPYIAELNKIIDYDIVFGLSSSEFLEELLNIDKNVRVHLEIETGMNRTGINVNDLDWFIDKLKSNKNIIVEGVYTHLSSADYDEEYTNRQLQWFEDAVRVVKNSFDTIKYVHAEASNGILNYNVDVTNLVRPGLIMYGYETFEGVRDMIELMPVCKLKSKITFLKEIDSGEYVGYSNSYKTNKRMKIATVPIGYADGLNRMLSNKGNVVVNGIVVPIIGKVCMDSIMLDVTNVHDVIVGDDVYIWDNDKITLDDVAGECSTINYEIISTISDRVPRIFI